MQTIPLTLGGIGIFLIGMIMMTNGLKSLGGKTLRTLLSKFTGHRMSAITSGFVVTSMVQASSATILATIGFVSAGMIQFTQVIAIIFGANLGTTTIGWLVSVIGFKLELTLFAMPMVGIGALMMLLARGKKASLGMVIAGFGMLFVGISTLQSGMKGLAGNVDFSSLSGANWLGRFLLILVGISMSIMTQSSSAALVTTIAALYAGAINLMQAAPLIIGQSIGKTSTPIIATIGASEQAKRACAVHVIFNAITGALVFVFLPLFVDMVNKSCQFVGITDHAVILSAFNTIFNLFGIAILFPFIPKMGAIIEKMFPEKGSYLTRNLDSSVARVAPIAVEAARRAVVNIAALLIETLRKFVHAEILYDKLSTKNEEVYRALREVGNFLEGIPSQPGAASVHDLHLSLLHSVDHLERLVESLREIDQIRVVAHNQSLRDIVVQKFDELNPVIKWLQGFSTDLPVHIVEAMYNSIVGIRKSQRVEILEATAKGEIKPNLAMELLEAMRWVDRLSFHMWRSIYHLSENLQEEMDIDGAREPIQRNL